MLSKKIMISIVMVPLLWMFYAVLMMALTDWEFSTKVSIYIYYTTTMTATYVEELTARALTIIQVE